MRYVCLLMPVGLGIYFLVDLCDVIICLQAFARQTIVGETPERRGEARMSYSECIDTILN